MQSLRSDPQQFVSRYRTALRYSQTKSNFTRNDRGILTGHLRCLYDEEERAAKEKIQQAKEKRRLESKEANKSDNKSTSSSSTNDSLPPSQLLTSHSSTTPLTLSTQCNVCYSDFNSDPSSELVLRVHMRLCGHNNICHDCFRTYLTNRIESDDCLPFIPCPEPNCKLTLTVEDIVQPMPTAESLTEYEQCFNRQQVMVAARNSAALNSALMAQLPKDENEISLTNPRKGKLKKKTKSAKSSASSSSSSSSSGSESDSDDSAASLTSTSTSASITPSIPIAPVLTSAPPFIPLLSTQLLLRLVIQHSSKILQRCREWLPCGTFKLSKDKSTEEESKTDDHASSTDTDAPSSNSNSAPCPFGFLLVPPTFDPFKLRVQSSASHSAGVSSSTATPLKAKLRKCPHCGELQEVRLKDSGDSSDGPSKPDDAMAEMIAAGTLRSCPVCNAWQMKDFGMCNIMQCHACQIWWNWSSRDFGKNQAEMKDRARARGTMWEEGELAYQLRLQREDPEAFKALLARNGIEYKANYVRGWSH